MGMYTAVADADQWKRDFGIDVEHIDQYEIIRRSELVADDRVENAFNWLTKLIGKNIHYDGKKLTPDLLKRQIRTYYACAEINQEKVVDFFGIKAQPELTDNFTTEDVVDAFSNDPYDFDGAKEPIVCATEADMDGALTMELFKYVTGEPVLFADVRHYDAGDNFFDLCNSRRARHVLRGALEATRRQSAQSSLVAGGFLLPGRRRLRNALCAAGRSHAGASDAQERKILDGDGTGRIHSL